MRVNLDIRKTMASIRRRRLAGRVRRLTGQYDFGGFRRIYFYHIRKTAGTSLIRMFLSADGSDGERVYSDLGQQSDRLMVRDQFIFVGWDRTLIEQGNYAFAFSHIPFDQFTLPTNTFRLTCFRDPIARVISHYRMLLDFSQQDVPHSSFQTEGQWLGETIDDFLDRLPGEHLQNQLYMFSSRYSVDQAVNRVRFLNHWMFVETFDFGLHQLGQKTGFALNPRHDRKSFQAFELPAGTHARLREMLNDEYRFLDQVRKLNVFQATA